MFKRALLSRTDKHKIRYVTKKTNQNQIIDSPVTAGSDGTKICDLINNGTEAQHEHRGNYNSYASRRRTATYLFTLGINFLTSRHKRSYVLYTVENG
ncbi:hypothetical protein EVAR_79118_1 [Eumeta japonica]|uniref:Uncharacterized protein n=1 Tax=Eumeta variegata TaxID=151549 RepID=A0A4C1T7U0_EUMVA|nr:hypothetical protein EVAR_79118_1 [Eumeta japonica]